MNWFRRSKSNKSETQGQGETLPLLRILALSGPSADQVASWGAVPPVDLVGFVLKKEDKDVAYLIPTLARNGHVSLVYAASTLDVFHRMQEDVSARFARRLGELRLSNLYLTNFLVVGFTLAFPEDPSRMFLVYETLVSPEPIPELADVYNRLRFVTDVKSGSEVERYFADAMRKRWLNEFIARLEKILNWPEFVAEATKRTSTKKPPFIY
jgi:hypothetical protein